MGRDNRLARGRGAIVAELAWRHVTITVRVQGGVRGREMYKHTQVVGIAVVSGTVGVIVVVAFAINSRLYIKFVCVCGKLSLSSNERSDPPYIPSYAHFRGSRAQPQDTALPVPGRRTMSGRLWRVGVGLIEDFQH